ncbi:H(+)-transporting V1 sector ATPase subunit H [Exophiala dermatitidis]|uniref:V-type proton ATPase subunit H n=2 Tax=Exophiala dermatitidis TaxID=5970 RepID=H6BL36_EXODN|nr:V-type H+-transporting ATPase 54 kDa subunit [Exophiala dermatitidis NIH/UT8656]KAJ4504033.1 H(+)-transporting V1 sector ATPase subunit H [Exophiala dermatitidis]EHY52784.1 V-type H+-transporting ATPase 54 kDa subunit [Exophiala dermatitidis NIH/UT8656]KAJ4507807.1 H(+)-transporting V1 sector ATPase subunit H [Exophiala dermatitidis]KAJ4509946.1 H(+)-transporting V1 sector ATPase subunit H [Exophiala dermatitidis]KAJ4539498.1 H(+)-transporting V1 sector ATPase subunit H [Exophiala dermatiti
MSLSPPAYLSSLQNNIRARPIPWDGAVRAGNLTEDQLKKIRSVDKVRKDQRRQTIEQDVKSYSTLLVGGPEGGSVLEKAFKRTDIIQYLLVLATDLVNDAPALATAILEHPEPYKIFLSLLNQSGNPEDPIPLLSATFLVNIIAISLKTTSKPAPRDDEALPQLYSYLAKLVKNQDSGLQDIGVQHMSQVLRTTRAKELFWKQRKDTVEPLFDILRKAVGAAKDNDSTLWNGATSIRSSDTRFGGGVSLQLMYHVLLVIWQLSFEGELVGEGLEKDEEIVPLYTQLLRMSPKEKTTRLLLATLRNLLSTNKETLIATATTARLPALLTNLSGRHLTDPDLLEDLEALKTMLDEYTKNQTTFDEYADEVNSGHLRWSPPHRNHTFWRENARRIIEDKRGELPKKLADILSKNWESDKQVLAIGCNDVGHLVKEVPEHRSTLERLGIKARLLELMADPDESVRWESLKAIGEWMRYTFDK